MSIHEQIRKCVVYLGVRRYDGPEPTVSGTALILGRSFQVGPEQLGFRYLVTARHVVEKIKNLGCETVEVRVNLNDGSATWLPSHMYAWVFHPDPAVDVAVLPFPNSPPEIDHVILSADEILSPNQLSEYGVGLGSEVVVTGLFWHHPGRVRNLPIIRTGNIAAMPEEPIQSKESEVDGYLVELRSIAGLSGSPVFARVRPRRSAGDVASEDGDNFFLVGLIHGHFDVDPQEPDAPFIEVGDGQKTNVNVGMAIVVPASRVKEVFDQSDLGADEIRELQLHRIRTRHCLSE